MDSNDLGICLVNANHPESQGCNIKDQKDFISQLSKFQSKLHDVSQYQNNPLPLIYGQALMVAIYTWILLGVFGAQYLSIYAFGTSASPFNTVLPYLLLRSFRLDIYIICGAQYLTLQHSPTVIFFATPWFQVRYIYMLLVPCTSPFNRHLLCYSVVSG